MAKRKRVSKFLTQLKTDAYKAAYNAHQSIVEGDSAAAKRYFGDLKRIQETARKRFPSKVNEIARWGLRGKRKSMRDESASERRKKTSRTLQAKRRKAQRAAAKALARQRGSAMLGFD